MGWKLGATEFTDLSVTACSIHKNAGGKDKAVMQLARSGTDSAPTTVDSDVIIYNPSSVAAFRGIVRACFPTLTGSSENWTIEIDGQMSSLNEIVFKQTRACVPATPGGPVVHKYDSCCILGWSSAGVRQTTEDIVTDVLTYAATQNSGLTAGTIALRNADNAEITVPQMEVTDATCMEAINSTMRWHPDAVLWLDHSAGPFGTVNVTRPVSMSTITKAGTGAAVHLSSAPRVVRKVRGVVINWRTTSTLDDEEQVDVTTDSAGTTTGRRVVNITIPLNGSQTTTQSQAIETVALPQSVGDLTGANAAYGAQWLLDHFPEIAETNPGPGLVVVTAVTQVVDADGEMGPGTTSSDYPRELINGQITEWMSGISAAPTEVTITLKYTGDRLTNPELYDLFKGADNTQKFKIKLTGTDATTKTYRTSATIPGETPPTGLALDYYDALNTDWPEGSVTFVEDEIDLTLTPGKRLTITGDVAVTTALIQSVSFDVMTGKSVVRFGPAGRLEPNDFVELQRAGTRARPLVNTTGAFRTASAPTGGADVRGSKGGRILNTSTISPARSLYGFEVTQKSASGTTGEVNIAKGIVSFWKPNTATVDPTAPAPDKLITNIAGGPYTLGSVASGDSIWLKISYSAATAGDADEYNFWLPTGTGGVSRSATEPDSSSSYGWVRLADVTIADGVMTITPYHVGNVFAPSILMPKIADPAPEMLFGFKVTKTSASTVVVAAGRLAKPVHSTAWDDANPMFDNSIKTMEIAASGTLTVADGDSIWFCIDYALSTLYVIHDETSVINIEQYGDMYYMQTTWDNDFNGQLPTGAWTTPYVVAATAPASTSELGYVEVAKIAITGDVMTITQFIMGTVWPGAYTFNAKPSYFETAIGE